MFTTDFQLLFTICHLAYSQPDSVYEHLKFNGIYQTAGCTNITDLLNERLDTTNRNKEKF